MDISQKIYKAALKFLNPLTVEETYKSIVAEAMKLVNAEIGSILLEVDGQLERVYATDDALYTIIPRKGGYMHTVAKSLKPKLLTVKQIRAVHPEIANTVARSDIIIPLAYRNKSIGVLTVMSRKDMHFSMEDFKTLKLFAPFATLAIRKTQLYEETKQALATRDLFISMASHELRTPLTTIYAYMQLMQLKLQNNESLDPAWVDTMLNETMRLTLLVNELLQVDQINHGKLQYHFKKCDITEIVNRAVSSFGLTHQDFTVIFTDKLKKHPTYIRADFDKILQVIINLLTNAAKFSAKGSKITILLTEKDDTISLRITDEGKGIAKEDLPKIFDEYYRGENHKHEGMGLGLYLSKNIITEHTGAISARSTLGKGTTIIIRLNKTPYGKTR